MISFTRKFTREMRQRFVFICCPATPPPNRRSNSNSWGGGGVWMNQNTKIKINETPADGWWMDESMDAWMWMQMCVVWNRVNPKPNRSAQNTKCTILWSRIWRWQGKQTSGKWIKLHSRIAEFWRIFLLPSKTKQKNTCSVHSKSLMCVREKPKKKTLWYVANVRRARKAPSEYDKYTHTLKCTMYDTILLNSIEMNDPFRSSSMYRHYQSANRNHFQCRNLTTGQ